MTAGCACTCTADTPAVVRRRGVTGCTMGGEAEAEAEADMQMRARLMKRMMMKRW